MIELTGQQPETSNKQPATHNLIPQRKTCKFLKAKKFIFFPIFILVRPTMLEVCTGKK
jgi:hypothetical protein